MLKLPPLHSVLHLPVRLFTYILSLRHRLRRHPLRLALWITGAFCVASVFVIFITASPSGENDGNFWAGIDAESSGIVFLGNIYDVNIPSRTISVSWLIAACGHYRSTTTYQHHACRAPNIPVSVYINGASQPNFTYEPALQPHSQLGGLMAAPYVQALDEFQTTHFLDVFTQYMRMAKVIINTDQAYAYPFDVFYMETHIVIASPNVSNSSALPILAIGFAGYSNDLVPFVYDVPTTTVFNGTVVNSRWAYLTLKRTHISIVFVLFILIINWSLTVVAYVTIAAYVSRDKQVTDGIVVLPITVILTIAGLRALFIDAPPFGILIGEVLSEYICFSFDLTAKKDVIGLFMQMIIVSICSILLLFKASLKPVKQAEESDLHLAILEP